MDFKERLWRFSTMRMHCCYFIAAASNNNRARVLLYELACAECFGDFAEFTCEEFETWFTSIESNGIRELEFSRLFSCEDFRNLCHRLYNSTLHLCYGQLLRLKSSDRHILVVDKSAATAESVVLKDLVDSTGGQGEIPVPGVSTFVLAQICDFCQKKHDFSKVFLESHLDHYNVWVTEFLRRNKAVLDDLQKAADFLQIQSLLTLTTQARKELVGNA